MERGELLNHLRLSIFITLLLTQCCTEIFAQQKLVKGKVISKDNAPLAGVTISNHRSKLFVQSDQNGQFSIPVSDGVSSLRFSFIGYVEKEQPVPSTGTMTVEMETQVKELENVIVYSGYSSQRKKDYTGAASQVNAATLENKPAQSFTQLLGGQAAGVDIVQPSNGLNNPPVMRVRGVNSISSGIYPLVIVDGVTVFTGSAGSSVGNDPLSDINPNDIETIDVLKDASATAIYGSRAANGVLVITTKKGKRGKARVRYDGWGSVTKPYNLPELLDANEYVEIKNEARTNAGLSAGFALMTDPDGKTVNTNWYDVAYKPAFSHSHNVSVSGANEETRYFLSLGYTDQNSFVRNNNFKRNIARLNIDHKLFEGVTVGATVSYSNSLNAGPNTGSTPPNSLTASSGNSVNSQYIGTQPLARLTYILPPNVPVYNEDGSYHINPNNGTIGYGANSPALGVFNAWNAQTILDLDNNSSENNAFIGSAFAEWTIVKGLTYRMNYGMNTLVVENKEFRNPYSGDGASARPNIIGGGSATNSNTSLKSTTWTNTLTYAPDLGSRHHVKVLGGYEEIHRTVDAWGAVRSAITDPYYKSYQGGWSNIAPSGNYQSESGLISFFSTINYDFESRYLFSFNFRRDGLSALASGNKWGNFSGGSVGWNISEENFFRNSSVSRVISSLKIRGSYGVVGNSNVPDFAALSTFTSGTYGGIATLYFAQAGNPALKWETSKKTDIGLNIGLFDNRISIEADYFNNLIDGLILNSPQASSQGIPGNAIAANVGAMYNRGVEFSLNAKIIRKTSFQWNASVNFATLENKVTELGEGGDIYPASLSTFGIQNMTRVGYSAGSIFAVPTTGVNPDNGNRVYLNRNDEEVQYDALTKRWSYLDGSLAPAIDNYGDGRILGQSLPSYYGGFNNTFHYGNFDMNIGINFSGGNKLYNGTWSTIMDQRYFNSGKFVMNRWQKPGDVTDIPKLVWGDNFSNGFSSSNSAVVENGAYIKLKNVSLGYKVPLKADKAISSLRFYVHASNFFIITRYRGSDPEVSINGNSINSGKDQNVPPSAWVMTFGANVSF